METEMEEEFIFPMVPSSSNIAADIAKSSTIVEEGPRICPLCNSIVKPFFVNFNEKILMCENTVCEFPFSEKFNFFKEDNELASNVEVASIKSKPSHWSQGTASVVSTAEWSEIDRLNKAYEAEDSFALNAVTKKSNQKQMDPQKTQDNDEQIQQNVEQIKQYNKVLFESEDEVECIRNEKWIKNLFTMQTSSGVQLLKEQELQKLKKNEPVLGVGELKIDIDSRQDSISSIKIQINSKENETGDKEDKNP